jgi:hypothetical protein
MGDNFFTVTMAPMSTQKHAYYIFKILSHVMYALTNLFIAMLQQNEQNPNCILQQERLTIKIMIMNDNIPHN